jgi:hypothetical protein
MLFPEFDFSTDCSSAKNMPDDILSFESDSSLIGNYGAVQMQIRKVLSMSQAKISPLAHKSDRQIRSDMI